MNRRDFFRRTPQILAAGLVGLGATPAPVEAEPKAPPHFQGIGVLRVPQGLGKHVMEQYANLMSEDLRQGSVLVLSNCRDYMGEYEWDFRIEGGDPSQVRVEHRENILEGPA